MIAYCVKSIRHTGKRGSYDSKQILRGTRTISYYKMRQAHQIFMYMLQVKVRAAFVERFLELQHAWLRKIKRRLDH